MCLSLQNLARKLGGVPQRGELPDYGHLEISLFLGKRVSTKAVGYYARNDITDEYKFPEGSILERASVKNALLKSKNPAAKITKKGLFTCLI